MKSRQVLYRVEIPKVIMDDPIQAVVDGLTMLHHQGGMPAVERALETVLNVVYDDE